ncbi:MAG TPA: FtsX-like permease family protein, partial [Gemmatimonadaceae bacterium]|nr:FtsX-like permease family protein [Gemmatimonadaceae bacterium]
YTIVGVAPAGLDYPNGAGYWLPWPSADGVSVIAIGRLAPGATASAAAADVLAIVRRIPQPWRQLTGAKSVPFVRAMLGDVRPMLVALGAAVALLLVIACVNVGGLLLLRAGTRSRELAIRRALGATYGEVVKQLLLESTVLAAGGGLLGLVSAVAFVRALLALAPAQLPRVDVVRLAGAPVFAAIGVTAAAVLLFGTVPAFLAARTDVAATLRLDSRSGRDSASRRRFRHVLVASQTTLALVMLTGGALLARSLARLESIDLGYTSEHLTQLASSWPSQTYDSVAKLYPLGEDILRRWRSIPGVVAVTPVLIPPLLGDNVFIGRLDKEGQSESESASDPYFPEATGDKDYFRTFGTPILRGRDFTDADRENAEQVMIVSEMVAKRVWPGDDPIGKRAHYLNNLDSTAWRTVIGVAADAHVRTLRAPSPMIYIPWRQLDFWQFNFAIRTRGDISAVLPALRRELGGVDPRLKLWYVHPMDQLLAAPLAQPRMGALLMSIFAVVALTLAATGLYGLMASVVRERVRELGIRMALGASPSRLRRGVLGQALAVSGAGALVGVIAALGTSRLLSAILFQVSPTDPVAIAAACAVLLVVVLVAAYAPARWATKIDPATALRSD